MVSLQDLSLEDQEKLIQQAKLEIQQKVSTKAFEDKLAIMKKKTLEENLQRLKHIKCANNAYSVDLLRDHVRSVCNFYYRSFTGLGTNNQIRLHSEEQYNLYEMIVDEVITGLERAYADVKSAIQDARSYTEESAL